MLRDRKDAGRRLARRLHYLKGPDTVVLGLPRGGVPVAFEVAEELHAPLDVIVVRKLGVPSQPELAMGAVGEDGVTVVNERVRELAGVSDAEFEAVEEKERAELERRSAWIRGVRQREALEGKTAVIVDDGIATGSTAAAACQVAWAHGAKSVVMAAPVGPIDCEERFAGVTDDFVCLDTPPGFYAIGQFYNDFSPTSDSEVIDLLSRTPAPGGASARQSVDEEVTVAVRDLRLPGFLTVPADATGIVVFAHGSGSSRLSRRNRYVASVLHDVGVGTLLFDLLTAAEEVDRSAVFDIELLARRLTAATQWVRAETPPSLPIGYFGASTGAAAALWAAADPDADIAAIVSRGGRPDLAGPRLAAVRAPTLLIVGGHDVEVLGLNRRAQAQLTCENDLAVVPGATHLFEEPGTLTQAAQLARDWFTARF